MGSNAWDGSVSFPVILQFTCTRRMLKHAFGEHGSLCLVAFHQADLYRYFSPTLCPKSHLYIHLMNLQLYYCSECNHVSSGEFGDGYEGIIKIYTQYL